MRKCPHCGNRMRRVHRSLLERISYLAIYSCKECHAEDNLPRAHQLHRGKAARCPKCGTYRITRLKERDHIDPMHTGLFNAMEKMAGGRLYHCRFCRIQFWDRRRMQTEVMAAEAASREENEVETTGTAKTAETVETTGRVETVEAAENSTTAGTAGSTETAGTFETVASETAAHRNDLPEPAERPLE